MPRGESIVIGLGSAIGVALLVIGLVTLARTGIPTDSFTDPTTTVGPFLRTPLMGIIEIVLGVLMVGASATADQRTITAVGLISVVFGIVWMIEPGAFGALLGVGRASALLYATLGVIAIVTGVVRVGPPAAVVER